MSQREWVSKTGLEDLQLFRIPTYPLMLGYNLVENFDDNTCSLKINGEPIEINEADVEEILGIPRGAHKVRFSNDQNISKTWRKQFSNRTDFFRVEIRKVAEKLISTNNVDWNFKINFLCVLISMMMEHPVNSYVRHNLVSFIGDLDRLNDYNWSGFLIESLKDAKTQWYRDPKTIHYSGSLPFLLVRSL